MSDTLLATVRSGKGCPRTCLSRPPRVFACKIIRRLFWLRTATDQSGACVSARGDRQINAGSADALDLGARTQGGTARTGESRGGTHPLLTRLAFIERTTIVEPAGRAPRS